MKAFAGWLSGWLNSVSAFLAAQYQKIIGIGGFTLYMYYSHLIDNYVWWFVLDRYGYVMGNLIMTASAFPHNLAWLLLFNWIGFDWLATRLMDELRQMLNGSNEACLWEGMSSWRTKVPLFSMLVLTKPWRLPIILPAIMLGKGDKKAFWALSIFTDSFVTTAYLRHGNFESIKKRDLRIFFPSTLIGCIYWSIRSSFIVYLLRTAWSYLFAT